MYIQQSQKIRLCLLRTLAACSLLFSPAMSFAQETVDVLIHENGGERMESIDLPEGMTCSFDSLLSDWKAKTYLDMEESCSMSSENPTFSDSVYIDRLSRIPAVMEMPYNEIVRQFIDTYTGRLRKQVSFMLGACNFYMPIFEEALDAYNLPLELRYLPVIESSLNPSAVSRAGASGLWQFMISTGKLYGLKSNSLVDERRDPIKATWAAVRYLKDMYDIYKDWNLVIAAYNCGPGNVNKAIRRAGGKTDYWAIYNYLPRETRGYVPAFIAVNYVMNYYCKHNICPMETDIPSATDTVMVTHNLHFQQIISVHVNNSFILTQQGVYLFGSFRRQVRHSAAVFKCFFGKLARSRYINARGFCLNKRCFRVGRNSAAAIFQQLLRQKINTPRARFIFHILPFCSTETAADGV